MRFFSIRSLSAFAIIWMIFCLKALQLNAQINIHCGTQSFWTQTESDAHRRGIDSMESLYRKYRSIANNTSRMGSVKIIPVVVHFIQETAVDLIPDARAIEQIKVLNEDFRKLAGSPGFGYGVDTQIEFCLASIDPNGCPTNGINRVVNSLLSWHNMAQESQMKSLIQWDPSRYMNIWVPKLITGGILGYARYPNTLLTNPAVDGIVINGNYFGRNFGIVPSSYDLGRTATHEVGHWLGLIHTFDGGCAGTDSSDCDSLGDRVCDTPPTSNSNFGCPGLQNTCMETPVDSFDQTLNYMDYTNDACMNMLTQGQTDRMNFFLNSIRTQLWSPANLSSTGCDGTISPGCIPQVNFLVNANQICPAQTVQFTDVSTGPPTAWQWSFPGGTPASSALQNPVVFYATPGIYAVTLIASNALGADTLTLSSFIITSAAIPSPLTEGFENAPSLPAGWYLVNEDNSGTWELSNLAFSEGANSIRFDNFTDSSNASADDLVTLPIDFQNALTAEMNFDIAYRRFTASRLDTLKVMISSDCGLTWTEEWMKTGLDLATVIPILPTQSFVPQPGEWRTETLDLHPWLGVANLKIAFRNISRGGQAIWLDNIQITGLVNHQTQKPTVDLFCIIPNPSNQNPAFQFNQILNGANITILNPQGQQIFHSEIYLSNGAQEWKLPNRIFDAIPAGIYFVSIQSNGEYSFRRWIKALE